MRYLSGADVTALQLSAEKVERIAERTLRGLHAGSVLMAPRPILEAGNGVRFMAFPAVLEEDRVAGVKWLGIEPYSTTAGRQRINSCIVLSALDDGTPLALVDAQWVTAIRTATVSLIAARRLAHRESSRIAFIACGKQARFHLDLFADAFPIRKIACYSRRIETAKRFAAGAQAMGYIANAHETLLGCVEGADIVISSSPNATAALMEPAWLKPGCFVSLVDLGRSIQTEKLSPDDLFVVDDVTQFRSLLGSGALKPFGEVEPMELPELPSSAREEKCWEDGSRKFFLPTGLGAIDIAIAWELLRAASTDGVTGTEPCKGARE